jgi:HSP20 family molecular chaperone IbpA
MDNLAGPATFDEFFNDYFGKVLFVPAFADRAEAGRPIRIDVQETDNAFIVLAELDGAELALRAEVDESAVSAEFKDGVLRIMLPKKAVS